MKNWFTQWFDTEYYHILYKDRDHQEAGMFIDNITSYLNLPENAKVLDLACGKGRHSISLNKLGYDVTGVDLSANSIHQAKMHENDTLHFFVHDMREKLTEKYDAIFNLFTSFGYFENDADHATTLCAIRDSLTEYGFAVMDFLNVDKVIPNLVAQEIKMVDGIEFHIARRYQNGYLYKDISFSDKGEDYHFTERVKALRIEDFERMMNENDIYLLDVFGDYKLGKFKKDTSDRLIMIFK